MTGGLPTRSRIEAWDQAARGLSAAASDWRSTADLLERCADTYVGQIATPGGTEWSGAGAAAAAGDSHADRSTVYRGAEDARILADVAARGAGGLQWGRQATLVAIVQAEQDGFRVAEDLSVADRGQDSPELPTARRRVARSYYEQIVSCATRLQAEDARIAAQLQAGATHLVGTVRSAWGVDDTPAGPGDDPTVIPSPEAVPAEVNRWWESLTPQQQARLIAQHPPELGNLNGIPAAVRGEINHAVLDDDITRVQNAVQPLGVTPEDLASPDNGVFHNPAKFGLSTTDITRYRNAQKTRDGLQYDHGSGRPVLLWAYGPLAFNGQGKAAIAIGNPDRAHNTTVIVPGAGSSVAQGWLTGHVDAVNIYDQSVIADPHRSTAVIAWMGYDAPDGLRDTRLTEPGLARQGGDLLARDVNGLWATHQAGIGQHVTVIGHSYGATTVADAFAHSRLHANDAILLGCPGTDLARSAADFQLDGGRVYVGAASTDPVSWIGQTDGVAGEMLKNHLRAHGIPLPFDAGLGRDPAGQGFGSVRFHAEVPGSEQLNRHDHARYYLPGGEALRSMTDIVTGHPERLAPDGLLAEGRRQPRIGAPSQIHLPGLPPIQIPHRDIRIPGIPAYIDPEGGRHAIQQDPAHP